MKIDLQKQYGLCQICGMAAETSYTGQHHIDCIRCGRYSLSDEALHELENAPLTPQRIANISGYISENPGLQITTRNLDFLRNLRTPAVAQRALRLLAYLAKENPGLNTQIDIAGWRQIDKEIEQALPLGTSTILGTVAQKLTRIGNLLSVTWSGHGRELVFLLLDYLDEQEQLIKVWTPDLLHFAIITPKGWQRLETAPQGESSIGFVAMWFDREMSPVWEQALYPGIYDAGYTPLRIDKKEHLNKIDDEILASIRGAKFLVADFTGHRGGVYYEAGFAGGLGKPVIWTVKYEDLHAAHFDTRQYNYILWSMDDLPALRAALKNRIEATLGRGPIAPA